MAMEEKYDVALLGILQNEGKIETFLNVIMGFLYRRTDFYRIMKDKNDRLGFPQGVAINMLASVFKHYDDLTRKDDEVRDAKKQETEKRKKAKEVTQSEPKASGPTEGATAKDSNTLTTTTNVSKQSHTVTNEPSVNKDSLPQSSSDKSEQTNTRLAAEGLSDSAANKTSVPQQAQSTDSTKNTKTEEETEEDTELSRQQKEFQANPDSYNGAVRDNYSWSQSITDVDLKVKVPSYIRKGKDCRVEIAKKHVKVAHKDEGGGWTTVVDGDLTWDVDKEESMWSLNPGQTVHINFEKKEERWWEGVLTDEPKINVRKIDASRPMTDLDDEAQAKIEEMMYNDRQKKMGLPQSHEQKMYDTLRNAWDAEGSPFKGQPFDPSKLNVDPSGVINMKPN